LLIRVEPVSEGMRASRRRTKPAFTVLSAVQGAIRSLDKFA